MCLFKIFEVIGEINIIKKEKKKFSGIDRSRQISIIHGVICIGNHIIDNDNN